MKRKRVGELGGGGALLAGVFLVAAAGPELKPLFEGDGPVKRGWVVRAWDDVAGSPREDVSWVVRDGILRAEQPPGKWAGTWLLSEKEYGDFVLELDFKFKNGGKVGNGGIALRAPLRGDPAYEGLELQITDPRYEESLFPNPRPDQLTGALYLVEAPKKQMYRADDWNHYRIEMRGPKVKVWLNGEPVQDVDLDTLTAPAKKHGKGQELLEATPGARRPRKGRIGFQELSDDGEVLLFRALKIVAIE
jgi:hypothetical protein